MSPVKPYLIRAVYEWIIDNNLSPYISVDTTNPQVSIPKKYIENSSITLDISPESTNQLLLDNEAITFQARFSGKVFDLYIPVQSVVAIYAQENQQGMTFPEEEYTTENKQPTSSKTKSKKLKLKVIDGEKDQTK